MNYKEILQNHLLQVDLPSKIVRKYACAYFMSEIDSCHGHGIRDHTALP